MKQKVALVLSSGGARGMAHIGVIEELEKQGFEISSIAGSSIGAVVGGIVNPIPIDHVHREKDDILVVVDLNSSFSESRDKLATPKNEPAQYQQILNKIKTRLIPTRNSLL